jgi:predicted phage-related endonuclease
MKTLDLIQGSPEWAAHRATHFNASDAAAMLGCSPYTTRSQLLHRLHTGIAEEVDAGTQRRFNSGHAVEAAKRPAAAAIIGEALYPCVGTDGELSASFDGLTMAEDTNWECKSLNDALRAALPHPGPEGNDAAKLPKMYRVQMEQQAMVSGCARVLFTASNGQDDDRHCWYTPDPALRAEILAGWRQFAADLAAYVPPAASAVEKLVAEPVEALPAPVVQVTGQIALVDNFKVFEERLRDFLANKLIREPKTDEDFVNLDAQIKGMKAGREALKAAKAQMLAQVQPVDQANKTADMLDTLLQQNVSMAERLLTAEKERRKGEIVAGGVKALADHIAALNTRLGERYMPTIPADFGGAVKGLKSLASMEDKVNTELARAKIAANEVADRIQVNMQALVAAGDKASFPDAAALVLKASDDLRAIIAGRVAEAERKAEAQREAIRQEELARIERERQAQEAADRRAREEAEALERRQSEAAAAPPAATAAPTPAPSPAPAPQVLQMRPAPPEPQPVAAGDEWQPAESMPKHPTTWIQVQEVNTFRFLPYKPNSTEARRGLKGRWQRHNGYGFENCEPPVGPWRIGEETQEAAA